MRKQKEKEQIHQKRLIKPWGMMHFVHVDVQQRQSMMIRKRNNGNQCQVALVVQLFGQQITW